ncbi:MetQ/NlpA family ABC transporter substrate-binding protein [Pigmentibacter sp. JX0631]|uniref:MetQ/NlpA family ABC transporter substrate-binding protein n=1 Tax=Pigmentibacter sp. JX0631 TaxID=2976982 RepID=UPI0024689A1C|nr:MetQ/NlpA family ABC transporter substrate-binding protein [Pigmentibacter sp. JX0631]WGL60877.1 MetQ/NlpA family ABC transporter substrate-binding protein [Pigmentibacter sp. JX0631]
MKIAKLIYLIGLSFISIIFSFSVHATDILKVGITAGPMIQVFDVAKKLAKEKYDLEIKTITFADYQIPNEALNSGEIDANIFQTVSFLEQAKARKGYKLAIVGNTFIYPMGVYSRKIKNLNELTDKSVVIIPNDPSNQGRALNLLKTAGIIKIKDGVGELPTPKDISENPKNIVIKSVDAAQAARAVQDVAAAVLNNDFVKNAGFVPADALIKEDPKTAKPYVNVIVVKESDKSKKVFDKLKAVMNSNEVLKKTQELFPGAVPAW